MSERNRSNFDPPLFDLICIIRRYCLVCVCYWALMLTTLFGGKHLVNTKTITQSPLYTNNAGSGEVVVVHGSFHEALQHDILDHLQKHLLTELNMKNPPSKDVIKRVPAQYLDRIIQESTPTPTTTVPSVPEGSFSSFNTSAIHIISVGPKRHSAHNATLLIQGARLYQKILYGYRDAPGQNFVPNSKRTYFHLVNMQDYDVKNATLYFFVQKPQHESQQATHKFTVNVYRYLDGSRVNDEPVIHKSFNLDLRSGNWVSLNATDLVHEWIKTPSKNYGIMIKAHHKSEDLVNRTVDESSRTPQIFLHIEFNEDTPRRVIQPYQEDPVCSADQPEERCCRYRLQVDFEAMGWDWIIAPKRYDAYYCAGSCPFNYKQSTPHTYLTEQVEASLPRTHRYRSIGPCCSPKEYQDLKIIYITEAGTVHERRVPDMMVLRCGCA